MSNTRARNNQEFKNHQQRQNIVQCQLHALKIVWMLSFIDELYIYVDGSNTLHVENISALLIGKNMIHHENTRHIEVDCHYIRELVDQVISFQHITSHDQLTNLFTKTMTRSRHRFLFDKEHQFERKC